MQNKLSKIIIILIYLSTKLIRANGEPGSVFKKCTKMNVKSIDNLYDRLFIRTDSDIIELDYLNYKSDRNKKDNRLSQNSTDSLHKFIDDKTFSNLSKVSISNDFNSSSKIKHHNSTDELILGNRSNKKTVQILVQKPKFSYSKQCDDRDCIVRLDLDGHYLYEKIDYSFTHLTFNKLKNRTDQAYHEIILDNSGLVRVNLIYLNKTKDKLMRKKLNEFSISKLLSKCEPDICSQDFDLKGITYFDAINEYSYFYKNTYLLSANSLQDVLIGRKFNATKKEELNLYTSKQCNYFGSYLNESSVFYDNNVIFALKYEDNEIKLKKVYNFSKQSNNHTNAFQNLIGLISYQKRTFIFYQNGYQIYESEHDFTSRFLASSPENRISLKSISDLFSQENSFIDKLKLKSVNFLRNEFIFRFFLQSKKEKKDGEKYIVVIFKGHSYNLTSGRLRLSIAKNYSIDVKSFLEDPNLINKLENPKRVQKTKNSPLVLIIALVFVLFGIFTTLISSKANRLNRKIDKEIGESKLNAESDNQTTTDETSKEKSDDKESDSKNEEIKSTSIDPSNCFRIETTNKPKSSLFELLNLEQALFFQQLMSNPNSINWKIKSTSSGKFGEIKSSKVSKVSDVGDEKSGLFNKFKKKLTSKRSKQESSNAEKKMRVPEIKLSSKNRLSILASKKFETKKIDDLIYDHTKLDQSENESKESKNECTNKKSNSIEHKTYSMGVGKSTGTLLTKDNSNFDFKEGKIRKKILVYDLNNSRFKSLNTISSQVKNTKVEYPLSRNLFKSTYQNEYWRPKSERQEERKRKRKRNKMLKYEKLRRQFGNGKDEN